MTMANLFVVTLLIACAVLSVNGHGRLSSPLSRGQYANPKLQAYQENEPTGVSPSDQKFICRTDTPAPVANYLAVRAGDSVPITVVWEAPHPGGCAVYLTHDGDKTYSEMKWYKIWETTNCIKATAYSVPIPNYLPSSSHAIMRWEWYGLQNMAQGNGFAEFYVQCVDITIQGQAGGVLPQPQVNIPGHLPAMAPGKYWDPYNANGPEYVTGPQVATRDGTPNPTITATTSNSATTSNPAATSNSATTRAATSNAGTTGNTNPATGTPSDTTATTCTPGTLRCPCIGSGNACNQGLTCASGLCVSIDDISKIGAASTPAILVFVSVACILLALL